MRRFLPVLAVCLVWSASARAHGLLIPEDKKLPPLAMVHHRVNITIDDQVVTTRLEQTFRNHTDRQLEATYIFPVPKGASVNKFTMWVDGKEQAGELLDAPKANQIYTEIVRRTLDPGLLEYMGNNMFKLRIFPVPPKGDQKITLSFTSVATADNGLIEYVYPLKTNGKATQTLEEFAVKATIKSQHAVQNVYSPTHAITLSRAGDKEVTVAFEKEQALLDKDFALYYSLGDKDVGLTALAHRPVSTEDGHFMLLLSPKVEMSKDYYVPRDMVLVLDTSGSMNGIKMEQAKKALKHCLSNLKAKDRFAVINFSTTVNRYRDSLLEASGEQIDDAKKWVDRLKATGGTAINDALMAGLALRTDDSSRTFTMVFFTDGQPTIGETDVNKIVKNVVAKNNANTRIFTFGVGESDGINATFLDTLADQTRAFSTFVREKEDIEAKVQGLYTKISHPVLANLNLSVLGDKISLSEVYPPQLPDLFHGGQVVVFGRYTGNGPVAVKLTGQVGDEKKDFVYELTFPQKTSDDKLFVEDLWARRKVGFLLDQIRANGEKKELVDEVTALAKKYGIATPYTSYLVVPDSVMKVVGNQPGRFGGGQAPPAALAPGAGAAGPRPVQELLRDIRGEGKGDADGLAKARNRIEEAEAAKPMDAGKDENRDKALKEAQAKKSVYDQANDAFRRNDRAATQANSLGVNLSIHNGDLKTQTRMQQNALQRVAKRNCLDVGGVWIDEGFDPKMPTVTVKAMSDAYFKLLEKQPQLQEVFKLGNHLVWVTPSGTALVIDTSEGKETLSDAEIAKLFVAKK